MFSFSMGDNQILGGEINLPFMFFLTLAGATVQVDDQVVVLDGALVVLGALQPWSGRPHRPNAPFGSSALASTVSVRAISPHPGGSA